MYVCAVNSTEMRYSSIFCGLNSWYTYQTVTDSPLAYRQSLSSISGRTGMILNSFTTSYLKKKGPLHGGLPGGGPAFLDLSRATGPGGDRVVAVSTCCSGPLTWRNSAQLILLRTASGTVLKYGDPTQCIVPQRYEPVPPGFVLGGFETQMLASEQWVHKLRFIFVKQQTYV